MVEMGWPHSDFAYEELHSIMRRSNALVVQCTQCGNAHPHYPDKVEGCRCCERVCRQKP